MADSSPEGSPTPRKNPMDGGVLINKTKGKQKAVVNSFENIDSPAFGQHETLTQSKGIGLVDKAHDPKGKVRDVPILLPRFPSSPDRLLTISQKPAYLTMPPYTCNQNYSSTDLDYSTATAVADNLRYSIASGNTSTDEVSAGPVSASLTSSSDSFSDPRGLSVSTTPMSEENTRIQILSRKFGLSKLDSTHLSDQSDSDFEFVPSATGLGISIGSTSNKVHTHEFAEFTPATSIFTPSSAIFTPASANFTPAAKGPWNNSTRGPTNLMRRSIAEKSIKSTPLSQVPFNGPGVIGQPSGSYRYNNMGNQYHHFQSAPYTQPLPQSQFPRSSKGGYKAKKYGWNYHGGYGYDNSSADGYASGSSSRSMTPAFGTGPHSLASSTASLSSMNHGFYSSGYRAKSSSNLNARAAEFNGIGGAFTASTPWNPRSRDYYTSDFMTSNEPLNYRRLAEKNMSTDWKVVVDKIVFGNDQQASLFLQQKIKNGDPDQRQEIIQLIIDQGVPLMANRFGNFLIQRCMEHGSPENINDIAERILGHTVNLSMDAFGCHVVQKAFDYASDRQKRIMVHELVGSVQTTIIHRYACHVWQKLFELKWDGTRPPIMRFVNDSLKGMWHEVALGETGSLVVQNIFENCPEHEKRPCIEEVLQQISPITTGQFGNWCVQHICEHGAAADKGRAIDHILMFATGYSQDQFGSKVVEKCLKVCGNDFLDRYLERVCSYRQDVPRMDLIDIAGDQYGNYLIQHILSHADNSRKEIVASHIRRHMVSLRGSKYGSRVALLCTSNNGRYNHGVNSLDRTPGGAIGDAYQRTGPWGLPRQGAAFRGGY
ncbi:Pumilio-family RNA-binding repeat-containing protein 1 [Elsinoe fawcettii]|nr:Pumilio-family RNA-binding repeat-containing protein 1 [Elsinoe fawcettii]